MGSPFPPRWKNRSLAKPSGEALLGIQGAYPVLAFPPTPLLPSLCQMLAKEPQDKIHQPISKVIERNRLKMVRRRIWVPTKDSLSPHTVLLGAATCDPEGLNRPRPELS